MCSRGHWYGLWLYISCVGLSILLQHHINSLVLPCLSLELEFNGIAVRLDFVLRAYGGIRSTGGVKLCVVVLKCMRCSHVCFWDW